METGNWSLTLARSKLFDKSNFSGVMEMKAQSELGKRRREDKAEEETMLFAKMGYRTMGQYLERSVGLRESG